jgi:CelD/BcsL family acetyltransferase involved in cellulose biosynthesis
VKVSVVRPEELGAPEVAAWRAMQRSSPELANPFLSPGFALAAGRVRPSAWVGVLEDGPELVGFFPFEKGRLRIGRPIAAGVSDTQGIVHAPGLEWSPLELLEGCGLDVWDFDHLILEQHAAAGGRVTRRSAPIIDVSDGYEAYAAERRRMSKKIFSSTWQKHRKLERDCGATRFEFDATDRRALGLLMRWKSGQYRRTGRRDRFAVKWIERLVWDLFETRSHGCAGALSVLYCGERVVAVHFGLRSDRSLSCWFPTYDADFARYSPGLLLHLLMARAAAEAGLRHLDLGKGDEPYKQSLKSGDLIVGEGWIHRPSLAAALQRVTRAPARFAHGLVLSHPQLRHAARTALARIGSVRSSP